MIVYVDDESDIRVLFLANVKAHPPLGARASVERGVEVVITEKHVNRAAPSGWMERLVSILILLCSN